MAKYDAVDLKCFVILMPLNLIDTRKFLDVALFCIWEFFEPGNGLIFALVTRERERERERERQPGVNSVELSKFILEMSLLFSKIKPIASQAKVLNWSEQ